MNLCKNVCSIICSEATAYFLLDLYFSNATLARIVVVRDREIGKKCKLVVLYLIYAFLESLEIIMKLGAGGGFSVDCPSAHKVHCGCKNTTFSRLPCVLQIKNKGYGC